MEAIHSFNTNEDRVLARMAAVAFSGTLLGMLLLLCMEAPRTVHELQRGATLGLVYMVCVLAPSFYVAYRFHQHMEARDKRYEEYRCAIEEVSGDEDATGG